MRRFWTYLKLAAFTIYRLRRFPPIMLSPDQIALFQTKATALTTTAVKANGSAAQAATDAATAAASAATATADAAAETAAMNDLQSWIDGGCVLPTPATT